MSRHRANELRPRTVVLRDYPALHTFLHGWQSGWSVRQTHFRNPSGRENTYRDEGLSDLTNSRRDVLVAFWSQAGWLRFGPGVHTEWLG